MLVRGQMDAAGGRQGRHHDPRLPVRHGHLRGHPRLLERGAGPALRAEDARALRAAHGLGQDHAHGSRDDRGPAGRDGRSSCCAATATARTRTCGRRSTSPPRRSACGCTTSRPAQHLRRPVRRVHQHRPRDQRADGLLAAQQRRLDPVARQDRRLVREPRLLQVGGAAQRLRRGDRADARRARVGGQRGEPVHGAQRASWSRPASRTTSWRASRARR